MDFLKSFLYYIFIFFIALYILLVAFSPEKMMDVIGFRTFIVLSNSMEPKLNVNDMIVSKRVTEDQLEVGDIVTFTVYIPEIGEDALVTHYLGSIEQEGSQTIYQTRRYGLDEDESDVWLDDDGNPIVITFSNIEGEYVFKIPYVGFVQQALSNRILLGMIIVNVVIIYIVVKMLRTKDNEEDEDDSFETMIDE